MASFLRRIFSPFMFWNTTEEEDKEDSSSDSSDSFSESDDGSIGKDLSYFNHRDWLETDSTAPPPYSESSFYMGNRSPGPRYPSRRRISPVKYPNTLARELAKEAAALGFPLTPAESSADEEESYFQNGRRYGSDESYSKNNSNKNNKNKKLFGSPKENSGKQKASPARPRKKNTKAAPASPQPEKVYTPDNITEMLRDTLIKFDDRRQIISDETFADVERQIYHSEYVDPKNIEFKRGRDYCMDRKRQSWNVRQCKYDEPKPAPRNELRPCLYTGPNFH